MQSHTTAARWAARYRQSGAAGMADRSSRPHRSPNQLPLRTERRIIRLRVIRRLGPGPDRLGIAPEPLHCPSGPAPLTLPPPGSPGPGHRRAGPPLRARAPGELIVDIKKPGNIPDGGGHRTIGRSQGKRNRITTPSARRSPRYDAGLGYGYLHTALDDHSRLACTEILPDECKETAAAFLTRAHAWYSGLGITLERVISDNGSCYRSKLWNATCAGLGITPKRTRPYRPQTNGKVERFHRTLADEWACARPYATESHRRNTLPDWLHTYNNHRPHTALGGNPPASRVTNLSGQYN